MNTGATCHRGTGHLIDRDAELHVKVKETTNMDIDDKSTNGSEPTFALGEPEAEDRPDEFIPNNQAMLTAF